MTGINATCQLYFQVNWVKTFIVVLIITEHNRGQQVYSSPCSACACAMQGWQRSAPHEIATINRTEIPQITE